MTSIFQFGGNTAFPIQKKITTSTATAIIDATNNAVLVAWFEVSENAGATPNLSVYITDGTTTYYPTPDGASSTIWNAKAVTANLSLKFTAGYVIPKKFKLYVLSSDAAGKFDVLGVSGPLAT